MLCRNPQAFHWPSHGTKDDCRSREHEVVPHAGRRHLALLTQDKCDLVRTLGNLHHYTPYPKLLFLSVVLCIFACKTQKQILAIVRQWQLINLLEVLLGSVTMIE